MNKLLVFDSVYFNNKTFERACNCFSQRTNEQVVNENVLDIYHDEEPDKVFRVSGDNNIRMFNRGNISNIQVFNKLNNNVIIIDKYDLECKIMNNEKEELLDFEISDDIVSKKKTFKMMKEYKYVGNDAIFKIHISQFSEKPGKSLREAGMSKTYTYTYVVELLDDTADIDMYIREMVFVLDGNIHPLEKEFQMKVLSNYMKDVKDMFHPRIRTDKPIMVRPKPATLERTNLLSNDVLGVVSVMDNYAVTEKADGERYLLYIDDNGDGYLIANATHVRGAGMYGSALKNTLLDGELVLCDSRKKKTDKDLFAVFDIYMLDGKNVTDMPLIIDNSSNTRYAMSLECVKKLKSSVYDIVVKKQLTNEGNKSILDQCNTILNSNYDYDVDGLIFTPTRLSIFAVYANKPIKFGENQSWDRVFKWKPSVQNSIDFVVKDTGVIKKIAGMMYREYKLLVGQRMDMEDISVLEGLRKLNSKDDVKDSTFIIKEFIIDNKECIAYLRIDDNDNKCYTHGEDREVIHNNSVIEFTYDMESPMISDERRWVPIRVRHDKNRVYQFGEGDIKGTANSYKVALNVWRTIIYPVTEDMITGKDRLVSGDDNIINAENKYYNRVSDSIHRNLLSSKMNEFHNHVIKDMLYMYPKKRVSLLELACGQGSDKGRWMASGYRYILGIDYTKDNITNPEAGVYARMIGMKNSIYHRGNMIPKSVFVVGDCTKSIKNGDCSKGLDTDSYNVLRYVYGRGRSQQKYEAVGLKVGMFNNFDVVACMFSIHYFFETEDMLNGFLNNVASNCSTGKLLLTFMDGVEVQKALNSNNGELKGIDEESGSMVWAIIRRYNPNQNNKYGKKIDVFLENTGKLIRENIVDFNLLVEKCKEYNLTLERTGMFEDTFHEFKKSAKKQRSHDIVNGMDTNPILKQFSFLNRWCVFKRLDE